MRSWKRKPRDRPADEASVSDDAQYEMDLVDRIIAEGRSLYSDPELLKYMAEKSTGPVGDDLSGDPKYRLVEMPEYLEGRRKMTRYGANTCNLDSVILLLRYGCTPPRNCEPHEVQGDIEGMMECRIHGRLRNWSLVYRYDDEDIVLHALSRKRDRKL